MYKIHLNPDCQCCSCKSKRGEYSKERHPNYKHGKYFLNQKCVECDKSLSIGTKTARCRSCASIWAWKNRQERSGHLKHGYYSKYHKKFRCCSKCGKKLGNVRSELCHSCENKRRFEEGIMNTSGDKNGGFIHGNGKRKYPKEFSKALKLKIFKRDGFTCQRCFIYPSNDLTAHHIDYNKQNCKEDNLIMLCRRCNLKVNKDVNDWYAYFTYLIHLIKTGAL